MDANYRKTGHKSSSVCHKAWRKRRIAWRERDIPCRERLNACCGTPWRAGKVTKRPAFVAKRGRFVTKRLAVIAKRPAFVTKRAGNGAKRGGNVTFRGGNEAKRPGNVALRDGNATFPSRIMTSTVVKTTLGGRKTSKPTALTVSNGEAVQKMTVETGIRPVASVLASLGLGT